MLRKVRNECYLAAAKMVIKFKKPESESLALYESDYNCGHIGERMTERGIELCFAQDFIKSYVEEGHFIEVGAVTPYYFPNVVPEVLDFWDKHEQVNHHCDIFDFDFTGYDVLSMSTIEHVGLDEDKYEGAPKQKGTSVQALNKLLSESRHCLITWPIGYNELLDDYAKNNDIEGLKFFIRGKYDNAWHEEQDKQKALKIKYSHFRWADAIAVVSR